MSGGEATFAARFANTIRYMNLRENTRDLNALNAKGTFQLLRVRYLKIVQFLYQNGLKQSII